MTSLMQYWLGFMLVVCLGCKYIKTALFIFGALWFNFHAQAWLTWKPIPLKSNVAYFEATIVSLSSKTPESLSLKVQIHDAMPFFMPDPQAFLYWKTTQKVHVGERWRFQYRPKPPTRSLNQGHQAPYQRLTANHLVVTGTVLAGELQNPPGLRWRFIESIRQATEGFASAPYMLALMTGQRALFEPKHWQLLKNTGVGHLFAISGMHLAVIMWFLFQLSFRLLNACWPSDSARSYFLSLGLGWLGCVGFAWVSGFGLPVQRALLMLTCLVGYQWLAQPVSVWQRCLMALVLILMFDPLAVLSMGLWLSFGALVLILMLSPPKRTRWSERVLNFLRLQCGLTLGMSVLQMLFFQGIAWHSLWLNLLLVPLFGFFLMPLTLVALLGLGTQVAWADSILWLLDASLSRIERLLIWSTQNDWHWLDVSTQDFKQLLWLVLVGCALFLWRQSLSKWFLAVSAAFFLVDQQLQPKLWAVHFLDVGQGLAVVVEHHDQALIFDTGARYPSGFSYAEAVITPFLRARGLDQVNYIVTSHADNDHAGGTSYLRQQHPQAVWIANSSPRLDAHLNLDEGRQHCLPGVWHWGELTLEVLWPMSPGATNATSCVLWVRDSHHSVLLTGDLTRGSEKRLLTLRPDLQADLLQVPHHGSKTSSSQAFLAQLRPKMAVISSGYQNYYHFPHASVVQRYQALKLRYWNTAHEGQVSIYFHQQAQKLESFRATEGNYWFNQQRKF